MVRLEAGVNPPLAGGRAAGGEGSMISLPADVRVLVATRPVDFRKGADGLAALVRETLRLDPFSGMVFVFRAKPADRVDESGRNKTE
jgi:transposase